MKLFLSAAQLDNLLNTGRIDLLPAYVDGGKTYYAHNCMFPVAIAELNCPETVIIHNQPYIEAGPWLTAIHTCTVPENTSFHPMFVYPDVETMVAHDMRTVVNALHRAMSRPVGRSDDLQKLSVAFLQGCSDEELATYRDVFQSFVELNPKFIRMAWHANGIPNADKFKTLCLQLPPAGQGIWEAAAQHIFKKWTLFT